MEFMKDKESLSTLAAKLVGKFERNESIDRLTILNQVPHELEKLFNLFDINASVDKEKLGKLISHTGISGGPREYFLIKINGFDIELTINHLLALASNKNLLKNFINKFPDIVNEMEKIKNGSLVEHNLATPGIDGSAFYSDIHLKLENALGKADIRHLAFHMTCCYLAKNKIKIWS